MTKPNTKKAQKERHMLELVAEAAGFNFDPTVKNPRGLLGCWDTDKEQGRYLFNSMLFPADAYEVQSRLKIDTIWCQETSGEWTATASVRKDVVYFVSAENGDLKRAITSCAAKIGAIKRKENS